MSRLNKKEYTDRFGEEAWKIESKRRNLQKKKWLENNPKKAALKNEYHKNYRAAHKEERKEYMKKYYAENKDKIDITKKKYSEENKEKIKETRHKKYEENRPSILAARKQYREENKDKIKIANKVWRDNNSECLKEKHREYYNSKHGRAVCLAGQYTRFDAALGFSDSTVTPDWIEDNIFTSSCVYCGETDWKHLGCDRVDNTLPHTPDNVVCACGRCNRQRNNSYTVDEFKVLKKGSI